MKVLLYIDNILLISDSKVIYNLFEQRKVGFFMKERKDGRYLNCYITRTLLEEFEIVCDIQGRTKTGVLEEAMQKVIDPFYSRGENGCEIPILDPKVAIYKAPHPKKPGKIKKKKCFDIDKRTILGVPSYKICVGSDLLTVPVEDVDLVE